MCPYSLWVFLFIYTLLIRFKQRLSKSKVLELIDYVLSKESHCKFMEEKLLDYDGLTFKSKVKLVHHLLAQMFEDMFWEA